MQRGSYVIVMHYCQLFFNDQYHILLLPMGNLIIVIIYETDEPKQPSMQRPCEALERLHVQNAARKLASIE